MVWKSKFVLTDPSNAKGNETDGDACPFDQTIVNKIFNHIKLKITTRQWERRFTPNRLPQHSFGRAPSIYILTWYRLFLIPCAMPYVPTKWNLDFCLLVAPLSPGYFNFKIQNNKKIINVELRKNDG